MAKSDMCMLLQVYLTMQMLLLRSEGFDKGVKNAVTWQREWTEADASILSMVDTIISGQANEDEMIATKFDRALATSGWSPCMAFVPQDSNS